MLLLYVVVFCASGAGYGVCKSFFASYFKLFGELIVFRHLNMDLTIFFNAILSDVSKLSLSFKTKNISVRLKYSHVDIDEYCFERELQ